MTKLRVAFYAPLQNSPKMFFRFEYLTTNHPGKALEFPLALFSDTAVN